jgi:hypothetical protein
MLGDYRDAPKSISWPAGWPLLDSDRAIKRHSDAYSIFMDYSQLPALDKFLAKIGERTAVKIGGKKFSVSTRDVFPSEPTWRKVFPFMS